MRTRLKRCDRHNIAVEELVTITSKKDGTTRDEWQEVGYYGHRLELAAEQALFSALPIGDVVTPEMVSQAVKTIVAETEALVKECGEL